MFDARIACEEVIADVTVEELAELNAWHDECDRREDEREERDELYSTISDLSKDVWGFRHRFNYLDMPINQLRDIYKSWLLDHSRYMQEEYDAEYTDAVLDYEDYKYWTEVQLGELATPDEWDDLYNTRGW